MKLFSPSSRALTRANVRLVNPRRLLAPTLLAGLVLNLGVFAGGIWVGSSLEQQPLPMIVEAQPQPAAEEPFTIDRVGVLVGRLQALQTDVHSLHRMLGEHQTLTQQLSALDPSLLPELVPENLDPNAAKGGLLLAPRDCTGEEPAASASPFEALQHGEATARCLRSQLDQLLEGVAQRNAALMAIPSKKPVPDQARLGSMFGNRIDPFKKHLAFHSGVDFAAYTGTDVYAAAGGMVRFASRRGGYGKLVEVDHGNGLMTRYAHLSRIHVRVGDVIKPGHVLGAVGSTGRSTGPHLHFEVLRNGRFVDPQRFLALADMEREADALVHD